MKGSEAVKRSWTNRTIYATALALFLGSYLLGCGKSGPAVPEDCRAFLDRYFEAVKTKDLATLQSLTSAFWNWGGQGIPIDNAEKTREVRDIMIANHYKSITEQFGDFKSYAVTSAKVTRVPEDRPATEVFRPGIHAEIECKAKFSKESRVRVSLHLLKETQESAYSLFLWKYQTEP